MVVQVINLIKNPHFFQSQAAKAKIDEEISLWQQLSGHDNIVKLIDSQYIKEGSSVNMMILSELCEQGTLFDLLQKYNGKLSEEQIIFIIKEISK